MNAEDVDRMEGWSDSTHYRRDEPGPRVARAWRISLGRIGLRVSSDHRDYPGKWIAQCDAMWGFPIELRAVTAIEAQREALHLLEDKLQPTIAALKAALASGRELGKVETGRKD